MATDHSPASSLSPSPSQSSSLSSLSSTCPPKQRTAHPYSDPTSPHLPHPTPSENVTCPPSSTSSQTTSSSPLTQSEKADSRRGSFNQSSSPLTVETGSAVSSLSSLLSTSQEVSRPQHISPLQTNSPRTFKSTADNSSTGLSLTASRFRASISQQEKLLPRSSAPLNPSGSITMESDTLALPPMPSASPPPTENGRSHLASSLKRKSEGAASSGAKKSKTSEHENGTFQPEDTPRPARATTEKGHAAYIRAQSQQAKAMSANPLPPVHGEGSFSLTSPESATSRTAPCHQHRRFCTRPMLQCTHMRDKKHRCRLWYCDYALKTYYGILRDSVIAQGRDGPDGDASHMCPSTEAGYIFLCPRCAGTCECSVCRHRRGLLPMAQTDEGHDLIAHARSGVTDSSLSEEPDQSLSPQVPKAKSKKNEKVETSKASAAKGQEPQDIENDDSDSSDNEALAVKLSKANLLQKSPSTRKNPKPKGKREAETKRESVQHDKDGLAEAQNGTYEGSLEEPEVKVKATKKGRVSPVKAKKEAKSTTKGKATSANGAQSATGKTKSSTTKGKTTAKASPRSKAKSAKNSSAGNDNKGTTMKGTAAKKTSEKAAAAKGTTAKGTTKAAATKVASVKAATTKGRRSSTKEEAPKVRPQPVIAAPEPEEAPLTTLVTTSLPAPNLYARIWIYEALLRFDAIPMPPAVLRRLDRLTNWDPRLLNQILEAVTACLAGVSMKALFNDSKHSASSGLHGVASLVRAVRLLHDAPDASARGEAWEAAREWLQAEHVVIDELPDVDHNFPEEIEERAGTPASEQSLAPGSSRRVLTRAGRAKLNNIDVQRKNLREASIESDFDDENEAVDDDKDYDAAVQSPDVVSEGEDETQGDTSEAGTLETHRGRMHRSVQDTPVSENPPELRRSSRARRNPLLDEPISRVSSASVSASRQNSTLPDSVRPSAAPEQQEQNKAGEEGEAAAAPNTTGITKPAPPAPVLAPPFEQRIAILGSLVNVFIPRTAAARADLVEAWNNVPASERDARAEAARLKTESKERTDKLKEKLSTETNQRYLEELHRKLAREERNLAWNLLAHKVRLYSHLGRTKLRSGSLGVDVDGREYWHLTEYLESMPKNTQDRWAWGLYIYGKPFPNRTTMDQISALSTTSAESKVDSNDVGNSTPQPLESGADGTDIGALEPEDNEKRTSLPAPVNGGIDPDTHDSKTTELPALSKEAQVWTQEKFILQQEPRWQTVNWPFWIFKTINYIKYRLEVVEADEKRTREMSRWLRAATKAENEAIASAPSKKSRTRASFAASGVPSLGPGAGPKWAATVAAQIVSLEPPADQPDVTDMSTSKQAPTKELSQPAATAKIDKLEEAARLTESAYEEQRKARRVATEELCDRLEKVLEYFMFHLGFIERSEIENQA